MTEYEILDRIKTEYSRILKDNLVGIYVHGSIAFGCFSWEKSDIDFIAVIKYPLAHSEKEALIRMILELDPVCPPKGIEMSVVLESVCRPFIYPTPFELHFSNAHKRQFQNDLSGYCEKLQGEDIDLAAHFTVIRTCGQTLCGPEITEVFDEVPEDAYLDSIRNDVADAAEEILENPVYMILNLCRVLAFVKEGKILSKAGGGAWGIEKLPDTFRSVAADALGWYCEDFRQKEKTVGRTAETLQEFAEYMLRELGM